MIPKWASAVAVWNVVICENYGKAGRMWLIYNRSLTTKECDMGASAVSRMIPHHGRDPTSESPTDI